MRAVGKPSGYRFLLAVLLLLLAVSSPGVAYAGTVGADRHPAAGDTDAATSQPTLHGDRHGQPELSVVVRHVPAPALPSMWPMECPPRIGELPPPGWSSTCEVDGVATPRTVHTPRSSRGPPADAS